MNISDYAPLMGTVGGGFAAGALAGYAIKQVIRIAAVIVGLFIAALAYLEYQKIISVDWVRVESFSQNGIKWIVDGLSRISNNIGASHCNIGFGDQHYSTYVKCFCRFYVGPGAGLTMNLQRLVGLIRKSNEGAPFQEIIGYGHIKRLFKLVIESESRTNILLVGPPASAKTMFLASLLQSLKDAFFVDGGNATKAGVIDYLFENHPQYLLIDEIDKLAPKHHTFLLNLMETGIISETKYGETREMKTQVSVFATCNETRNLSGALKSRFFVVRVEPFTYEQFYEITVHLLHNQSNFVPIIADVVWRTSRNVRDCVRLGKLAKSEEDVRFLMDNFILRGRAGCIS